MKSRLDEQEFIDLISEHDIIILCETKTDSLDEDILEKKLNDIGYNINLLNRTHIAHRRSGGIATLTKQTIRSYVNIVESKSKYVSWLTISIALTGFSKDLLVGGVYVPPEGSRYGSVDSFDDIEQELTRVLQHRDYLVLLLGDFNAHTKCLKDHFEIEPEDVIHSYLPCDILNEDYTFVHERVSEDKHRPNNYGYRFIDLCKSQSLLIFNGRVGQDNGVGKLTCNNASVADYAIGSMFLLSKADELCVHPFNALFSDVHCPLTLTIRLGAPSRPCADSVSQREAGSSGQNEARIAGDVNGEEKIRRWEESKAAAYEAMITEDKADELATFIEENDDVNICNTRLADILRESAKGVFGVTKPRSNRRHNKNNKAWFNLACKNKRASYMSAKLKWKRFKTDHNEKTLIQISREYRGLLKKTERTARKKYHLKLKTLRHNNPTEYWKEIKDKRNADCPINIEDLYEHFKNLNEAGDENQEDDSGLNIDMEYNTEVLNSPITKDEIVVAANSLKKKKASGVDNVKNEYIKHSINKLGDAYLKLFNKVIETGNVPDEWGIGLIKPLYKGKGNIHDCDNYRGITLLSCIGKLFTSVLNNRLNAFITDNNILSQNQAGFRKSHSTLDHVYSLKCLIDIFMEKKCKLYVAFVDYKKAFDSISRSALWHKLQKEHIDGKVLHVIRNMYNQVKSCVFMNDNMSDYFGSSRGVRQGENLSPLLFSLYLNDLEQFLEERECLPLNIRLTNDNSDLKSMLKLFVLLYADDTVMMSDSRQQLQKALDVLSIYCLKWKLDVNVDKTKIVIFHKRKCREKFKFNGNDVEVVDSFRYLGIEFSRTGNFAKGKKYAFDKAQRALFALLKTSREKNLPTDILLDLYQKMVVPVMLYGCEIWGHEKLDILEKIHLKSLKYILHLNRSTMTAQVFGESGFFPIYIDVKVRMISFWADLVNPSFDKLSNKVYGLCYNLFCSGEYKQPWLADIKETLVNAGLECVWNTQRYTSKVSLCKIIRANLKSQMTTKWREQLDNSSKCFFYKNYKSGIHRELFLSQLPEQYAIALVKFRCNNHKLPIEQGRKLGIAREERFCRKCDLNVLGDEFHFIMECPAYAEDRNKLIPPKFRRVKSTFNFCKLLSTNSRSVSLNLAKFIIQTKTV